jgi:hypothetical protein
VVEQGVFLSPTPKAMRVKELCGQGMSFDEAFAIADREYTSDGMALKPAFISDAAVLSAGVPQMGEVQF